METINITQLQEHPLLNELATIIPYPEFDLVGGAVIDLLEGRKPKDFDFIGILSTQMDKLTNNGFVFKSGTKTAYTFQKGEYTIQLLKVQVETFDYTISQASYNCKKRTLKIDKISFENKILIPTQHTFEHRSKTINALKRVPHYEKKGYKLPEVTYLSLLNNISIIGDHSS